MNAFLRKVVQERELEQEAAILTTPMRLRTCECGGKLNEARLDIGFCTKCCSTAKANRIRTKARPALKLTPGPPLPPIEAPRLVAARKAPQHAGVTCACGKPIRRRGAEAEERVALQLCGACFFKRRPRPCNACGKVSTEPLPASRPVCGPCIERYDVPSRGIR